MKLLALKGNKESPISDPSVDEERVQEDMAVEQWKGRNLTEFSSVRLSTGCSTYALCFSSLFQPEREGKN